MGSLVLNPRFIGPCIAGMFCLAVATVVGVTYLFMMASALLALPIAGYIVGSRMLRNCRVTRDRRITATQGERVSASLHVRSDRGLLPRGLILQDTVPAHIRQEGHGVLVPPETEAHVAAWIVPAKRGRYKLGPLVASAFDPMGMFRLERRIGGFSELIVYPKPVRVGMGRLSRGSRDFGTRHTSGRLAPRGDFAGVRDYRPGDESRRIHWKTTARTQRLSIVEYEECVLDSLTIAIDLSAGSDYGRGEYTSLDVATGAAAYCVRESIRVGRSVRLLLPVGAEITSQEIRGVSDLAAALTALAEAQAGSTVTISDLLGRVERGRDFLLVLTGSDGSTTAAVGQAVGRGATVSIALVDPEPFHAHRRLEPAATDLEHAGANVEVLRVVKER